LAKAEPDRCYSNGIQRKVGAERAISDEVEEAASLILSNSLARKQSSDNVLGEADRRSQRCDADGSSERAIPRFIDDDRLGNLVIWENSYGAVNVLRRGAQPRKTLLWRYCIAARLIGLRGKEARLEIPY